MCDGNTISRYRTVQIKNSKKQLDRLNNAEPDAKSYFRQNLYIPLLDNILADIKGRFGKEKLEFTDYITEYP